MQIAHQINLDTCLVCNKKLDWNYTYIQRTTIITGLTKSHHFKKTAAQTAKFTMK